MKKVLLILILILGVLNCRAQTQREKEEKIRISIDAEFDKNIAECSNQVDAVTDFNGKIEFWKICKLKNGNRILRIEFYEGDQYYQEIYFEKNESLVYAKELENYLPKNRFIQMAWNCEFYIKNGKLVTWMSLGHGKTENENWNPEIIFKMYKKRLIELERIKK